MAKLCRRHEAEAGWENGRSRGEGMLQGERQVSSRGGCDAIEEEVWGQGSLTEGEIITFILDALRMGSESIQRDTRAIGTQVWSSGRGNRVSWKLWGWMSSSWERLNGKRMLGGPGATATGIQVEGSWEEDQGSPGEACFKMGDVI